MLGTFAAAQEWNYVLHIVVEKLTKLFVRKGLSGSKYVLIDYLTETKVMILFLKAETWVLRGRTE